MGAIVNIRSARQQMPVEPMDGRTEKADPLDTEPAQARLRQLWEWLDTERQRQAENRYQMALDDDFFDGLQWSEDDAAELLERGQAPLVYNKVQPAVRWVTGTEKRTRIDFRVYPRGPEDGRDAEAKTKLLKYLSDVNKSQYARSRAFEDSLRTGVGWLECGIRGDPTQELLFDRYESWRNLLWDSLGQERDQSDWRYMIRQKTIDLDIAQMMFPKRKDQLASASTYDDFARNADDNDEWYIGQLLNDRVSSSVINPRRVFIDASNTSVNRRARIKLYEMWYRYPTKVLVVDARGQPFHGLEYNPRNDAMRVALADQAISLIDRVALRMRCAIFIKGTFLQDVRSPYRHDRFPFTPIWGSRRGRDNLPYGMIRNMRDPQEDLNKRMSKSLHAASTKRVLYEVGAFDDIDETRAEAARPDAMIAINRGFGDKVKIEMDDKVAAVHLQYAEVDARMLQDASGVTDENMGKKSNATSGIALERRQEQGSVVTADYFDNLRFGFQLHGEKMLANAEQFIDQPRSIRILGERSGYDMLQINQPAQDGSIENAITRAQADFVVSAQDFRETIRQAMFEQLLDMVMKIAGVGTPDALKMAMMMLDDVLELSDVPGKEDLVATVRKITGKRPPDQELSPEEKQQVDAEEQQQAEQQQAMEQMQLQGMQLELAERAAKVQQLNAQAEKLHAEAASIGNDASDEIRAEYEKRMRALEDDTKKLVDGMEQQVRDAKNKYADGLRQAQFDAQDAGAELASKERIDLIRARLDTVAKIVVAEIAAKAKPVTAPAAKPGMPAPKVLKPSQSADIRKTVAEAAAAIEPVLEAEVTFEHDERGHIRAARKGNKVIEFQTDSRGRITKARKRSQ